MEKLQPTTKLAIAIALIALLGGGYYLYNSVKSVTTIADNTKDIVISSDGTVESGDGYTVEMISSEDTPAITIPVPDLNRKVVFYVELPSEMKDMIRNKIATLAKELKENNSLFNNWLELGILWKQTGDFEAAIEAWDYASALMPSNNISFLNLGDLYHYYLKDFPKAEESFRVAIKNNPVYIQSYIALHELYKYSYKQNTALAVDVLNEALVKNPNNVDVISSLAQYYNEKGDSENALKYYVLARDAAEDQGDSARALLFQRDIDSLK